MNWAVTDPDILLTQLWDGLHSGRGQIGNPWRTPVLGTTDGNHGFVRVVVLRAVDFQERLLVCYSDARAPKIEHIRRHPHVEWLFYHPGENIQIRMRGTTRVHHLDSLAKEAWKTVPRENRLNYSSIHPPGTKTDSPPHAGLQDQLAEPDRGQSSDIGCDAFAVIRTEVADIDWLRLSPDGHSRIQFEWTGSRFVSSEIVP